jgi:hypothetical protein
MRPAVGARHRRRVAEAAHVDELALELGDVGAQRAPAGPLVRARSALGGPRTARAGRLGSGGRGLPAAAHEQGLGELTRVDAGLARLVRRGRGELGQRVVRAGIGATKVPRPCSVATRRCSSSRA